MRYILFIVLLGTIACTKENDVWRLPENPASSYVSDDTLWRLSFRSVYHNIDVSNLAYYKTGVLVGNYNVQQGKAMWYSADSLEVSVYRKWTGEVDVIGVIKGKTFILNRLPEGDYINVCGSIQNCPVTFNLTY